MWMKMPSVSTVISSQPPMRMIALWKAMLACEYSLRCADGSSLKAANRPCSPCSSSGVARSAAKRAARLSMAAQTMIMSSSSRLVLRTTNTPRRGIERTKPSCSR